MVSKESLKKFPDTPGIYLMKDAQGQVIYVGKAVSLKKRISSYFAKSQPSFKTQMMLSRVRDIECRETPSEHEALILESALIKRYQPRFNISLKDDKSFPVIKITQEDFPRVSIGRRRKTDEAADIFGPYTNAKLLRRALKILRKSFAFCTCRRFPRKVCLHYHLGLCSGPCQRKISKQAYRRIIGDLADFLTEKDTDLIEELSRQMRRLVAGEQFEEAAKVRDRLEALSLLVFLKKIHAKDILKPFSDFEILGLRKEPATIEAFDISNISGQQAVGSMVYFRGGAPDKNQYRRFKIQTVSGINDYAMIQEVLRRRYARLLAESRKMPDLIVIDGGAGHLAAARSVLRRLNVNVPVIAIAKSEDLIYTVSQKDPLRLNWDSGPLRLIQRVRDEAHRFALKYHHLLRKKDAFAIRPEK